MINIDRFAIPSVLQGTSHEKSPEVELEKGSNEKKTRHVIKKMTKDEKILILRSYISLPVKSDWDQLADNVFKAEVHFGTIKVPAALQVIKCLKTRRTE